MSTPPITADQLRRRAGQYIAAGNMTAAQAALESLLERTPDDLHARLWLSKIRLDRGQVQAATRLMLETTSYLSGNAAAFSETANQLVASGEAVAARICLDRAEHLNHLTAQDWVALAHVRHRLGESGAALALMDQAIALGANGPENDHFYGLLLQFVGQIDKAGRVLDRCLERWPHFASAAYSRARLRRITPESQHLDFLRAQLSQAPKSSLERASYGFALFKELDDLGRHEEAWLWLESANEIMRLRNPYRPDDDIQLIETVINHCDASFCAGGPNQKPDSGPVPIFIVGTPRSGTTLLDRMLGAHSNVASAGELRDFLHQWCWVANTNGPGSAQFLDAIKHAKDQDFQKLGARYLEQTQWRARGKAYFIDKMPPNIALAGFIHRALPQARILHLTRDPMAVCFSHYKMMFGDGFSHCYDMLALADYYKRQRRLGAHFYAALPSHAMLKVSYASLVQSPAPVMREVLSFCGLDFEQACLDPARNEAPVSTLSSPQVREPIHDRALASWAPYATELASLQAALNS